MEFANFSVAMAGVKIRQDIRDMQLARERGDRRAADAERLARARHETAKESGKFEDALAKIMTPKLTREEEINRGIFKVLTEILELMPGKKDKKPPAPTPRIGPIRMEQDAKDLIEALGLERWWKKHGRPRRLDR
jgi:hypothetical protein